MPDQPSGEPALDRAEAPSAEAAPTPADAADVGTAPQPAGDHPVARGVGAGLVLAALGVVFGDIGTSPLYALQTVFSLDNGIVKPTPDDVYGVISLVFWSVTLIVSIKYVTVIMRADNDGEGGVMALSALVRRRLPETGRATKTVVLFGILGAALFYGDSVITPAISVLSAVEGLKVAAPALTELVVPVSATILTVLFAAQRFGTHRVGALFGPAMCLWFLVLAVVGIRETAIHPGILTGLSPTYAVSFLTRHAFIAFVAMGAVVLCITGAEALYADMGHFGRPPIRRAWFAVVFPALTLNYLGQGALILHHPEAIANPFFLLLPSWGRLPMVVLATAATVIASQAVISGAFSVSRQAFQLGMLVPLRVRQTSEHAAGQVYLPTVNWALFAGVLALMLTFRSSARLATAYGVAVTGALLIDTILLMTAARILWRWPAWRVALIGVAFGAVEATFFSANVSKIAHGGWLPLLIATGVFTTMTTWRRGRELVSTRRARLEGPLTAFVEDLHEHPVPRVPGTAVFPHPTMSTTPLALRANVQFNGVLHERVVIVSAKAANVPQVPAEDQLAVDDLGYDDDGIYHLTARYGFAESPDIPSALRRAVDSGLLGPDIDPARAAYFVSRGQIQRSHEHGAMARWRRALFVTLAHNATDPAEHFSLPRERTVVMGTQVEI